MSAGAEPAPVLIVEDYEPVAELERRALVRSGVPVRVAGRIGDALALLQRESFSAVILDYQLPDGDPWAVVDMARSRKPRVPVIIVTAMGNEHVAAEAIHRGVAEYVRKTGTFYDELPNVVARVTKLARAEERLRRSDALFRLISLHSRDLITAVDANGMITSASSACRAMLGYEPEELVGRTVMDLIHPEDRARSMLVRLPSMVDSDMSNSVRARRKDGAYVWVESNSHIVRDPETDAPLEIVAITRDVMERRRAEDVARVLEATLRTSEVRTKAMLQVISSLIELQAMHLSDASARDALAESRDRVQAIALVHEKLCQSADLSHVGFDRYAMALVEGLCQVHAAAERRISAAVDAEPIELPADKAIPCGLMLNELVSNALRHAFPGGRAGSVRVALRRPAGPEAVELQVRDDGVGLPAGLEPMALGHGLVLTLAKRLGAEVDVRRDSGTTISIRFAVR